MGLHNSSLTRVKPVFDALYAQDPSAACWLGPLLQLPTGGPVALPAGISGLGPLRAVGWGAQEVHLRAPLTLLRWLAVNVKAPRHLSALGRPGGLTFEKRSALIARDTRIQAEALSQLDGRTQPAPWCVLEGPSCPDVYLETDSFIVVIEGKRTEQAPTTYTTWMTVRHQMLRHLDAAWERRGNKRLVGFFIVEGIGPIGTLTKGWRQAPASTVAASALAGSMPHRSPDERVAIAGCFLGLTTWQAVCGRFAHLGLTWATLPDRVPPALSKSTE